MARHLAVAPLMALLLVAVPATASAAPSAFIAQPGSGCASGPTISLGVEGGFGIAAPEITVELYAGPAAEGTPVATKTIPQNGGTGEYFGEFAGPRADGIYTVKAIHQTIEGTATDTSTIRVLNGAPTSVITAPAAGGRTRGEAAVPLTGDGIRCFTQVTVQRVDLGGQPVVTKQLHHPGADSWATTHTFGTTPGVYRLIATASVLGGSPSTDSAPVDVVVDRTPPTVGLEPVAQTPDGNDTTPSFSGSAAILGTEVPGDAVTVEVRIHQEDATGPVVQTVAATVDGTGFDAQATELPLGQYAAVAVATDRAGNTAASQPRTFFVIDTVDPAVTLTTPGGDTNADPVTFAGTAGTAARDGTEIRLELFGPGGVRITRTTTRQGAAWSIGGVVLAEGDWVAEVHQLDTSGNDGTAVRAFTADRVAPAVTLTAGTGRVAVDDAIARGTRGTAPGDQETLRVQTWAGDEAQGSPIDDRTFDVAGSEWFVDLTPDPAPGVYTSRVTQRDAAGNAGVVTRSFTVFRPAPPNLTISPPGPSVDTLTATITGKASTFAEDTPTVYVDGDIDEPVTVAVAPDGFWSATVALSLAFDDRDATRNVRATQSGRYGQTQVVVPVSYDLFGPRLNGLTITPSTDRSVTVQGSSGGATGDAPTLAVELASPTAVAAAGDAEATPTRTLTGPQNFTLTASDLSEGGKWRAAVVHADVHGHTTRTTRSFVLPAPLSPAGATDAARSALGGGSVRRLDVFRFDGGSFDVRAHTTQDVARAGVTAKRSGRSTLRLMALSCGSCTVRATSTLVLGKQRGAPRVGLGTRTLKPPAGRAAVLAVRLDAVHKRRIARARGARIEVRLRVRGARGRTATATRSFPVRLSASAPA